MTRFPPEPNGYLHIGHAKSICLNFGIARQFGGQCNLRMDDTNPAKEDVEYVDSITADVRWLIAGWADDCLALKPRGRDAGDRRRWRAAPDFYLAPVMPADRRGDALEPFYASDYFEQLYEYAVRADPQGQGLRLRPHGRGGRTRCAAPPTGPGSESRCRDRPVAESLDLFERMRAGEFPDGARTLRAKIDMPAPNVWLRDPVLYRIRHASHHHTGDRVVHLPDVRLRPRALERLHRGHHPQHLHARVRGAPAALRLDPRGARPAAPAAAPVRVRAPQRHPHGDEQAQAAAAGAGGPRARLGRPAHAHHLGACAGAATRPRPSATSCERIGVAKRENLVELALLEHCVREDLNRRAPRAMAVLRPLKVVIENYPEGQVEEMEAVNNPEDAADGHPPGAVLARDLDRAGRLPRGAAAQVLPAEPGRGGAAALGLPHPLHRGGEGPAERRGDRGARHLRPGDRAAATRPTAARSRRPSTGSSAAHAVDAEVRLYDTLFTGRAPTTCPRARTSPRG